MRFLRFTLLSSVVSLISPQSAVAQALREGEYTPLVGVYVPVTDIGALTQASPGLYLRGGRIEPTVSIGLTAEFPIPVPHLSTLIRGLATLPSDFTGSAGCFHFCHDILRPPTDARAWIWAAVAEIRVRPKAWRLA